MICENCGNIQDDSLEFCEKCKQSVYDVQNVETKSGSWFERFVKKNKVFIMKVLMLALTTIMLVGFLYPCITVKVDIDDYGLEGVGVIEIDVTPLDIIIDTIYSFKDVNAEEYAEYELYKALESLSINIGQNPTEEQIEAVIEVFSKINIYRISTLAAKEAKVIYSVYIVTAVLTLALLGTILVGFIMGIISLFKNIRIKYNYLLVIILALSVLILTLNGVGQFGSYAGSGLISLMVTAGIGVLLISGLYVFEKRSELFVTGIVKKGAIVIAGIMLFAFGTSSFLNVNYEITATKFEDDKYTVATGHLDSLHILQNLVDREELMDLDVYYQENIQHLLDYPSNKNAKILQLAALGGMKIVDNIDINDNYGFVPYLGIIETFVYLAFIIVTLALIGNTLIGAMKGKYRSNRSAFALSLTSMVLSFVMLALSILTAVFFNESTAFLEIPISMSVTALLVTACVVSAIMTIALGIFSDKKMNGKVTKSESIVTDVSDIIT